MREKRTLRGKKVAVLAADGFEYIEFSIPQKALHAAGAALDVVSLHPGKIRGMNLTEPTRTVDVDRELDDANPDEYDCLFIPGGFIGPDFLRQSARARNFVRAFDEANKPIATLCHGPWLLASAELVSGRTLAAWPGIRDDIVHAGGIWRDASVVRDRNWITSRGPQDLKSFVPAMLELFEWGTPAGQLGDELRDMTSSPKYDEPLSLAVSAARALPGPMVWALGAAAVTAVGALATRRS